MLLESEKKQNYIIIKPNVDKINYETANKFSKQTVELIENEKPKHLVLDLKKVTYISSIGVTALSIIKGMAKINNCNIYIYNITEEVLEILEQTGINTMFKLFENDVEVEEYFCNL